MENFGPFTFCCIVFFLLNEGACLKCRSRNQQVDSQFQEAFRTCKQRYTDLNMDNEDSMMSTEDNNSSDSDSNSEEDPYDKNFFYRTNDRSPHNQSMINQRYSSGRNSGVDTSPDRSTNGNRRDFQNTKQPRRQNGKSDFNREDSRYRNNTSWEQACIMQCLFNELNAVDQKGYPERDLVIPLMSRNIRNPDLKDFVEESIIECFRYLESDRKDKCEFSQNLLKCLAEKGQEVSTILISWSSSMK
ncbi:odorant-binding protein 59a isoform X2 [Andrena cerasifolii]|uniref:odorant-binding protein 59a isoform X2 n=1 Tax=Andrena cerasifolii TaxID=2819439 RepID=UPI004037FBA6